MSTAGTLLKLPAAMSGGRAQTQSAGTRTTIHVESVRTIHSDGQHHGFTSIARWRDKSYVAFRSARSHASPWDDGWEGKNPQPGRITLAESTDLRQWTTRTILNTEYDDRDPKLLATPDRLFVYGVSLLGPATTTNPQQTWMVSTDDGRHWTDPEAIYRHNYGFWKPKACQGIYYTAADVDLTPAGSRRRVMQVELLRSEDGRLWEPVSVITRNGKRTETSLVFLEDDSLLAVCRQNILTLSQPPYTDWTEAGAGEGERYKVMPLGIPGPAVERIGETIIVCCRGRKHEFPDDGPGQYRTSLFTLDPLDMSLRWDLNLPTQWGGDVSYAGILRLNDNRFLVSYYDGELYEKGVAKRSDIRLAELRISVS